MAVGPRLATAKQTLIEVTLDPSQSRALAEAILHGTGRASRPVIGDESRQAVGALRGYAYQIYASALAWLDLPPSAELHLEVAEDYAIAARDALRAVQVKDVQSTVSLAAAPARNAISAFVHLVDQNPTRQVRLTFLTTATVTREHELVHRTGEVPGIERWQQAAGGGEIADLRAVLLRLDLSERANQFIRERDDAQLRQDLLQRIDWQCGQGALTDLEYQLGVRLAKLCWAEFRVPLDEGAQLAAHLVMRILRVCAQTDSRVLTHSDLRALLGSVTRVGLERATFDNLLALVAGLQPGGTASLRPERAWILEAELPLPPLLVARDAIVACVREGLKKGRAVAICGGTGMGKTAIARLTCNQFSGKWSFLPLRNKNTEAAGEQLLAYARRDPDGTLGLIVDDVPDLHLIDANSTLVRAIRMLADRGELVLLTSARTPTTRGRAVLGLSEDAVVGVPMLSGDELLLLVQAAGGDAGWAMPIQIASRGGHPQLANALVTGLRGRGWPEEELHRLTLMTSTEVAEEGEATRAKLVEAVKDSPSRSLLHRVSMVHDRFPREVALALGAIPTAVPLPGERFDTLVGPWVDRISDGRYRISPLLESSGRHVLDSTELTSAHVAIAECLTSGSEILADQVDNIFVHGMQGRARKPLYVVAMLVTKSREQEVRDLLPHALHLVKAATDKSIAPWDHELSVMLRLAQVLLASGMGFGELGVRSVRALLSEVASLDAVTKEHLEAVVLGKILFREGLSRSLPEWPELISRLIDLGTAIPELSSAKTKAATDGQGIGAVLFAFSVSGLRGVAQLADAFDRLSRLEASRRDEMLGPLTPELAPIVQALTPWLRERDRAEANAADAIAKYDRMAELSTAWGQRDWAIAFAAAAADLCSQELHNADGALARLDAAQAALGNDRWLRRAAQKVLFGRKDDRAVVGLVETLRQAFSDTPIEAAHMLREGAISSSRLGDHDRAAAWLAAADSALATEHHPKLTAMAVGLAADAAAARWRTGDRSGSLSDLATVLGRLDGVDPSADLQCGYLHRIVRHSLLWFAHEAGLDPVEVDGAPPSLPPGACSNPDPLEAVLSLPLTHMDVAWYFLAQIAMVTGHPSAVPDPKTRISGGPITEMEIALSRHRLDGAIAEAEPAAFVRLLPAACDAAVAARLFMETRALRPVHEWQRTEIPRADPAHPLGMGYVSGAILAFQTVAAASGKFESVVRLRELLATPGTPLQVEMLELLFPAGSMPELGRRSIEHCARLVGREDLSPADLLECCLRLAVRFERSDFRRVVEPALVRWAKSEWLRIATARRFTLLNPQTSAPAIARAAETAGESFQTLAEILEAARYGSKLVVPSDLATWITSTARA